jgi:hypothetical protein
LFFFGDCVYRWLYAVSISYANPRPLYLFFIFSPH